MDPISPTSDMVQSSPPTQRSFNIQNVSRLSDSIWNSKQQNNSIISSGSKLSKAIPTIFSPMVSNCLLSSDPITSQDFKPNTAGNKIQQVSSKKRKSPDSAPSELQYRKVIRTAEPGITKQLSYSTAIEEARDLLVKAYHLTEDKEKQDAVLDLVEVFRNFTEEGRANSTAMKKIIPEPIVPLTPTQVAQNSSQPSPSYAQIVRSSAPAESTATYKKPLNKMTVLSKSNHHPMVEKKIEPIASTKENTKSTAPTTVFPPAIISHGENVITLITKSGGILPSYQPFSIRESVNKILGKRAISRVHTSVKGNVVLTCMDSSPSELLLDQDKWEPVFEGWPILKAQKVSHWPKLVVHSVPTYIPIEELNKEIEGFNEGITTQGQPRWLSKSYKQALRGSVSFSVTTEGEKEYLINSGVLIGGLLLKVVAFQQSTQKTQCQRCLTYGHHQTTCTRTPVCAICLGAHKSPDHQCTTCKATQNCVHHAIKCANCKSNTHMAFQRQDCDYYKALAC